MAKVKFIKTDQNKLTNGAKDEGQIILSSDTRRIFWDIDDHTRIEITDIIELTNEIERISLVNPLEKFYFVLSTKILWRFQNNEWIAINNDEIDIWLPQVSADGVLSWVKSSSDTAPESVNIKGDDGVTYEWLTGSLSPASGLGKQGDMYLNTSTYDIYQKTSSTIWTFRCNIKGITGNAGEKGKSVYPWNSSTSITNISQISGMLVGDAIVNTYLSNVSILGQSAAAGDIVVSISATNGVKTGNIKGATGNSGLSGNDAYNVILTNESHVFPAGISASLAGSTTCPISAFKGTTQMFVTVGSITGQVTGLTTSISNNGTASASITITVTTSLTARNGILTIPITVDGINFTKYFSWSLALTGATGATGSNGATGATGSTGAKGDAGLFYGICSTPSATVAKVVTLPGFSLLANALAAIKFTNANTASNPTLNINSLGEKAIYFNGSPILSSMLFSGSVFLFVFNGNQFEFIGSVDSYSRSEIDVQMSYKARITQGTIAPADLKDGDFFLEEIG